MCSGYPLGSAVRFDKPLLTGAYSKFPKLHKLEAQRYRLLFAKNILRKAHSDSRYAVRLILVSMFMRPSSFCCCKGNLHKPNILTETGASIENEWRGTGWWTKVGNAATKKGVRILKLTKEVTICDVRRQPYTACIVSNIPVSCNRHKSFSCIVDPYQRY